MILDTPKVNAVKNFVAFTTDEKKIEVNISIKDQNILFESFIDEGIEKKKYSSAYSLESLQKISKLLSLYDSLNEVFSEISNYIDTNNQLNKKCIINKNSNILSLTIPTTSNKFKDISFEMKEVEKTVDEKYDNLIKIINELNIKVNKFENENQELKNENIEIRNRINDLEKVVKKIQSENENIIKKLETKKIDENKEKNEINPFYESIIVKKEESKMICDWINPNKNLKFKLL